MKNFEVEARSFISEKQYKKLLQYFKEKGKLISADSDETVYFKAQKDLRIRKDSKFSYLILKEGKIHDKFRKEIEIKLAKEEFKKLEELIVSLGLKVVVRWYRRKRVYKWRGAEASLWITRGYGYLVELEKMSDEKGKIKAHQRLTNLLKSLEIKITPKKEFDKRFNYYKNNWRKIIKYEPR